MFEPTVNRFSGIRTEQVKDMQVLRSFDAKS